MLIASLVSGKVLVGDHWRQSVRLTNIMRSRVAQLCFFLRTPLKTLKALHIIKIDYINIQSLAAVTDKRKSVIASRLIRLLFINSSTGVRKNRLAPK